jgi:hypothetical protein
MALSPKSALLGFVLIEWFVRRDGAHAEYGAGTLSVIERVERDPADFPEFV